MVTLNKNASAIGIMVSDVADAKAVNKMAEELGQPVIGFGPNDDIADDWLLVAWPHHRTAPGQLAKTAQGNAYMGCVLQRLVAQNSV